MTGAAEDEAAADDEDVLVAVVEVEVIVWRYVEDPEVTVWVAVTVVVAGLEKDL